MILDSLLQNDDFLLLKNVDFIIYRHRPSREEIREAGADNNGAF